MIGRPKYKDVMDECEIVPLDDPFVLEIEDEEQCPFSKCFSYQAKRLLTKGMVDKLTPREERVIRMLFFDDLSMAAIGRSFGITRERVREMRDKALRRLMNSNGMNSSHIDVKYNYQIW